MKDSTFSLILCCFYGSEASSRYVSSHGPVLGDLLFKEAELERKSGVQTLQQKEGEPSVTKGIP